MRLFKKAEMGRKFRSGLRFRPRLDVLEVREVLSTLTVLNTLDTGPGSLRHTVDVAASGDTIVFSPSLYGQTITLTSGPVSASGKDLTIDGPGADVLAVSGNHASTIFQFSNDPGMPNEPNEVVISGLTLKDGSAAAQGGAINSTGASLVIDAVIFQDNEVSDPTFGAGGAVYVFGIPNDGTNLVSVDITDSSFLNNHTNGAGGAFQSFYVDVSITGTLFDGNSAQLGGSVTAGYGLLTITDSTIAHSTLGGGVVYFAGFAPGLNDTVTISGTHFLDNSATSPMFFGGGGALQTSGGSLNISTSTFERNFVQNDNFAEGGAIYATSTRVLIDGSLFAGNFVVGEETGYGGAIRLNGSPATSITNTVFENNKASGWSVDGGAIMASDPGNFGYPAPTMTLSGLTFTNNRAVGIAAPGYGGGASGGAVWLSIAGPVTLSSSLFRSNTARGADDIQGTQGGLAWGGALFAASGFAPEASLTISNTDFVSNLARSGDSQVMGGLSEGGAIYLGYVPSTIITGGSFLNNSAVSGAGGVNGSSALGAFGGAIRGGTTSIDGTAFIGNSAIGSEGTNGHAGGPASGGAIWAASGTISDSVFVANSAVGGKGADAVGSGVGGRGGDADGGALFTYGVTVNRSLFLDNSAIGGRGGKGRGAGTGGMGGDGIGGGIAFAGGSGGLLLVNDSLFTSNTAIGGKGGPGKHAGADGQGLGGGVAVLSGTAVIKRTRFFKNRASTLGDNIYGPYTS